jgi:hypothetical protein
LLGGVSELTRANRCAGHVTPRESVDSRRAVNAPETRYVQSGTAILPSGVWQTATGDLVYLTAWRATSRTGTTTGPATSCAAWRRLAHDNARCRVCRSAWDFAGPTLDELRGNDHALRLAIVAVDAAEGELRADSPDPVRVRPDGRNREQIRKLEVVEAD